MLVKKIWILAQIVSHSTGIKGFNIGVSRLAVEVAHSFI
jgi:hypothetical protein